MLSTLPSRIPGPQTSGTAPISNPPIGLKGTRCNFLARALYTRRPCRDIQEFNVEVFEISERHLRLRSPFSTFLPDSFTLIIGARQHGMGCAVIGRAKNAVWCSLIRGESEAMIAFLTTRKDERETLQEIRNPLFPKGLTDFNRP